MAGGNLTQEEFLGMSREEQNARYRELSEKDKFKARLMDVSEKEVFIPCNYCSHYRGFGKCEAYPDKIPKEVMHCIMDDESYKCSDRISYDNMGHKWKDNIDR